MQPIDPPSASARRLGLFMALLAGTFCPSLHAQDEAVAKREGQAPAELAKMAGDWTHDAPGTKHRVDLNELPPPYATSSSVNGPRLVHRPDDAKLQVPAGFKIEEYATGLQNPRYLLTAPNGDIFVGGNRGQQNPRPARRPTATTRPT